MPRPNETKSESPREIAGSPGAAAAPREGFVPGTGRPRARALPAAIVLLALSILLPSCAGRLDPEARRATQSYYWFLKSQYDELAHKDEEAVAALRKASEAAGEPYYLELETAKLLARNGRLDEARVRLDGAMAQNLDDPEPRLFAGYLASVAGRYPEAEKNYLEALRLDPKNEEAISYLGALYAESGRLDEASETFRDLSELSPASHLPDYFLGRVAQRKGDNARAARHFASSVAKKPDFVNALIELALINEQLGNARAAEKNYRQILRHRPDIQMAKARLARILVKAGKRSEAADLLDELAGAPQTGEDAALTIGLMFYEEGLFARAAGEFKRILRKEPESHKARYLLALTEARRGDIDAALEQLKNFPPRSELYADAALFRSSLLSSENRKLEALEALTEARRNDANSPMLLVATGRIMEEMDHLTQSRDLYLEGLKLFPDSPDVWFSLGVVEDRLGRKDECVKAMEKAVELDPGFADAINYIAYTYAEQKTNLKEALALAVRANTLKPDNGYYVDTLGWVYYQMKNFEKAFPLLEKASRLSGEDPLILEHLGDVLVKLGKPLLAAKAYSRALEQNHELPESIHEKLRNLESE
jgi:tetratricopeptide (TPR) repeat protein